MYNDPSQTLKCHLLIYIILKEKSDTTSHPLRRLTSKKKEKSLFVCCFSLWRRPTFSLECSSAFLNKSLSVSDLGMLKFILHHVCQEPHWSWLLSRNSSDPSSETALPMMSLRGLYEDFHRHRLCFISEVLFLCLNPIKPVADK